MARSRPVVCPAPAITREPPPTPARPSSPPPRGRRTRRIAGRHAPCVGRALRVGRHARRGAPRAHVCRYVHKSSCGDVVVERFRGRITVDHLAPASDGRRRSMEGAVRPRFAAGVLHGHGVRVGGAQGKKPPARLGLPPFGQTYARIPFAWGWLDRWPRQRAAARWVATTPAPATQTRRSPAGIGAVSKCEALDGCGRRNGAWTDMSRSCVRCHGNR